MSNSLFGNTSATEQAITTGLSTEHIMESLKTIGIPVVQTTWELIEDPNPNVLRVLKVNPMLVRGMAYEAQINAVEDNQTNLPVPYGEDDNGELIGSGDEFNKLKDKVVEIVEVDEDDSERFLEALDAQRGKIRDFLLFELAPMSMGMAIALDEFNQEISNIMDENVQSNFSKLNKIMDDAIMLKTYEFLTDELGLSQENADRLVAHHLTKTLPNPSKDLMDRLQHSIRQNRQLQQSNQQVLDKHTRAERIKL
ncbi:hypothetical protein GR7B_00066 [Vibrio phage vB_VcorM_GR7B]|nr:hypothetical protein GR7B_00066 [Vibrio phage vB_VcorM_GR7B]